MCDLRFLLFPRNSVLSSQGVSKSAQNFSFLLAKDIPTKERKQCGKIQSRDQAGQRANEGLNVKVPFRAVRRFIAVWFSLQTLKYHRF